MSRVTLAVVGAVLLLGVVACPTAPPCSTADAVMHAHGAECAARVHACADDACKAAVRAECNRWGDERCGFAPDGGEAGAP